MPSLTEVVATTALAALAYQVITFYRGRAKVLYTRRFWYCLPDSQSLN